MAYPPASDLTSIAVAPGGGGFWLQLDYYNWMGDVFGHNGETRTLNNLGNVLSPTAPFYGSVNARGTIITPPGRNGYWVLGNKGRVYTFGDVPNLCENLKDCAGYHQIPTNSEIIVGGAATPSGNGFWALDRGRRVFTVGDAVSYGDTQHDGQVATGFAATPSGKGYYIVHEDGGVFSFDDIVA
jgi:hypothetical protein